MRRRFAHLLLVVLLLALTGGNSAWGAFGLPMSTSTSGIVPVANGGSVTVNGYVYTRPIGTGADDWPTLNATLTAAAYKNIVVMLPGTAGEAWQCNSVQQIPNGTTIEGTPGTIINANPGTGSAVAAPFSGNVSLGPNNNITSDVLPGTKTISVTSSVSAGSQIYLAGGASASSSQYTVISTSGTGPFTLTVDRPVLLKYRVTDVAYVATITSQLKDVRIHGNGMVIRVQAAGASETLVGLSIARNVLVEDLVLDASAATGTNWVAGVLFDVGCYDVTARRITVRGNAATGTVGLLPAGVEATRFEDDLVTNCQQGVELEDAADTQLRGITSSGNTADGLVITQTAGNFNGSTQIQVVGGSYFGNGQNGVHVQSNSNAVDLIGVNTTANTAAGIRLDGTGVPPANIHVIGGVHNTNADGIVLDSGVKGTRIEGASCIANNNRGIFAQDDVTITSYRADGNATAVSATGGNCEISDFQINESTLNSLGIVVSGGRAHIMQGHVGENGSGTNSALTQSGGVVHASRILVDGSNAGASFGFNQSAGVFRWGDGLKFSAASVPFNIGGTASRGTVIANGTTGVAIGFTDADAGDRLLFVLKTIGGTVGHPKYTTTAGTGFTFTSDASDTSTYEYDVQ